MSRRQCAARRRLLFGVVALALGACGVATTKAVMDPDKPAPTREQLVGQWVSDLDSPDTETAVVAAAMLRGEGAFARASLTAAANDSSTPAAAKTAAAQLITEIDSARELPPVEIKFMARASCYAKSLIKDRKAPGGFGPSINPPRRFDSAGVPAHAAPDSVYLLAAPDDVVPTPDGKHKAIALSLVNGTGRRVALAAADSRLSIVREAKDAAGNWRAIEYFPSSWCGNSYHRVFLDPHEGWRFTVPVFTGPQKTTMRFTLLPSDRRGAADNDLPTQQAGAIHSNEFEGAINPEQFEGKQGHRPTGIMDPYLE